MSFSGMVKEELSRQISTARHCRIAEIAALLSACGKMTAAGILRFQTENDAVVRKYFTLLQKTFKYRNRNSHSRESSDEEGKCVLCGDHRSRTGGDCPSGKKLR